MDENKNKTRIKKLLDWFNSPIGLLATLKGDLEELELLITQKFRPVSDDIIKRQLEHIKSNVPDHYKALLDRLMNFNSRDNLVSGINEVMDAMNETVQNETNGFINKNKNLYRL